MPSQPKGTLLDEVAEAIDDAVREGYRDRGYGFQSEADADKDAARAAILKMAEWIDKQQEPTSPDDVWEEGYQAGVRAIMNVLHALCERSEPKERSEPDE